MQQEPEPVEATIVAATSHEEAPADLAPRLRSVEALPLDQRAAAFGALHDELRTALEGSDAADDEPGGR
jgi:hypothetical protein